MLIPDQIYFTVCLECFGPSSFQFFTQVEFTKVKIYYIICITNVGMRILSKRVKERKKEFDGISRIL